MTDAKQFTQRDVIEAERAAFIAGLNAKPLRGDPWTGAAHEAAKRYPFPKVTRLRVVADTKYRLWWKVEDGRIVWSRPGCDEWSLLIHSGVDADTHMVALWADLLANPTEEVEL